MVVYTLEQRWEIFRQKMSILEKKNHQQNPHLYIEKSILATFDFKRMALRATQPKLHSMFGAMFLKIALSAAQVMSFSHLGAAI